jgi:hypothetical protein
MSSTRSKDRDLIATTSSLVEFLRDVALARRRRIVDVAEYDTVLWLSELPAEINVDVDAGPGERLFAVPRLRAEAPPEPPAALTNWLDREALRDSTAPSPVLKEIGPAWVVVEQPDGSKGMAARALPLAEAPDVGRAFESWLPVWQAWAARDRQSAPFRRWYSALASAAHLTTQQEDQYELVLATGLVAWRSPSGTTVRNHVLTTRVIATVDSERDEVRVTVDPEAATRTQDRELLDGEPGYDAARVESMHDQVRDGAVVAPLVDCEPLAKTWAERALDDETPFVTEWAPVTSVGPAAEVRLAPAIVLRRRERASLIGSTTRCCRRCGGPRPRRHWAWPSSSRRWRPPSGWPGSTRRAQPPASYWAPILCSLCRPTRSRCASWIGYAATTASWSRVRPAPERRIRSPTSCRRCSPRASVCSSRARRRRHCGYCGTSCRPRWPSSASP